jgi:hypothetical protein
VSYYGRTDSRKVAAAAGLALALAVGHGGHHHHHHKPPPAATSKSGTPAAGGFYGAAERAWVAAGGPRSAANTAAAITGPESGFNAGEIQQGQPYATTGWGAWQITPGNSEPQCGTDQALLSLRANACAAVAKYRAAGNSFIPWTTYNDGAYQQFLR